MKKKNWTLFWVGFVTVVIIYLFCWLLFIGILGGVVRSGYTATKIHLEENTTATVYRLFVDIVIISLLIWRRK